MRCAGSSHCGSTLYTGDILCLKTEKMQKWDPKKASSPQYSARITISVADYYSIYPILFLFLILKLCRIYFVFVSSGAEMQLQFIVIVVS
jgi:hypothetical protein